MSDRIAAELREAYSAMTRFVHLMHRVCSTAPPKLQFSHAQTIYASNFMTIPSTKDKKAEKCETRVITWPNTHLFGTGIEYIIEPKTKFDVKYFRFFGAQKHKVPYYLPISAFLKATGQNWLRKGGYSYNNRTFPSSGVQVKFGFVCSDQFCSLSP